MLAGQASAGREPNTARKGRVQQLPSQHIDWPASLRRKGDQVLDISHLRYQRQPAGASRLHCVLLDCSASMLRGEQLAWAKGCLLALTEQAYRRREKLAVIRFAGDEASVLQAPAKAVAWNAAWIEPIHGAGGTPILAALELAQSMLHKEKRAQAGCHITLWLLTDGRFDALPPAPLHADECRVIDFERGSVKLRRCERLAAVWNAELLSAHAWASSV